MQPAQIWRHNQEIKKWLGKTGRVIAATRIRTSSPELTEMTPYSYAVIDFAGTKKELMATGHDKLTVGDTIICVLRKINLADKQSVIEYSLKAKKIIRAK